MTTGIIATSKNTEEATCTTIYPMLPRDTTFAAFQVTDQIRTSKPWEDATEAASKLTSSTPSDVEIATCLIKMCHSYPAPMMVFGPTITGSVVFVVPNYTDIVLKNFGCTTSKPDIESLDQLAHRVYLQSAAGGFMSDGYVPIKAWMDLKSGMTFDEVYYDTTPKN